MKTETQNKILSFIKSSDGVSVKEIIKVFGFHPTGIFRHIKKLADKKLIYKIGHVPNVLYYAIMNNEKNKMSKDNITNIISITIRIKEFGNILTSREAAKEAWLITNQLIAKKNIDKEKILVDFDDVDVLSAGWADEFISSLKFAHPNRVILLPSKNKSVQMSLEFVSGI